MADGAPPRVLEDDIGRTFREEFGRSVAALVRVFGDIDAAEDAAIAVAESEGPAVGLELVEALDLEHYGPFHATRADLLRRLGRHAEARTAYAIAASLAATGAEREFLLMRASSL